jgi:hypothetical protein
MSYGSPASADARHPEPRSVPRQRPGHDAGTAALGEKSATGSRCVVPVHHWPDVAAAAARVRGEVIWVDEDAIPLDAGSIHPTRLHRPAARHRCPRRSTWPRSTAPCRPPPPPTSCPGADIGRQARPRTDRTWTMPSRSAPAGSRIRAGRTHARVRLTAVVGTPGLFIGPDEPPPAKRSLHRCSVPAERRGIHRPGLAARRAAPSDTFLSPRPVTRVPSALHLVVGGPASTGQAPSVQTSSPAELPSVVRGCAAPSSTRPRRRSTRQGRGR